MATDRDVVLSALEDAADYRRDQGECSDCRRCAPLKCDDHGIDDAVAAMYDELHARIQANDPTAGGRPLVEQLAEQGAGGG